MRIFPQYLLIDPDGPIYQTGLVISIGFSEKIMETILLSREILEKDIFYETEEDGNHIE